MSVIACFQQLLPAPSRDQGRHTKTAASPHDVAQILQDRAPIPSRTGAPERLSALVKLDEIVQLFEPEFGQLHDGSWAAIEGRQEIAGLVLAVHIHPDPCLVYAVKTDPQLAKNLY